MDFSNPGQTQVLFQAVNNINDNNGLDYDIGPDYTHVGASEYVQK
jgi:hypothetical protein